MNKARRYWESNCPLACAAALGAALLGCEPSNTVPAGAPVMLSFGPIAQDGSAIKVEDAGGKLPTPPLARFLALFDRLLDPVTLEDEAGKGKPGLATVQSPAAVAGIQSTTNFVPNGDGTFTLFIPAGPSITVAPTCGMPSGAAVTVTLDLLKVRSHDQLTTAVAAADATAMLSFTTEPLAVATDVPDPMVDMTTGLSTLPESAADAIVNLTFNNLTPGDEANTSCAALPSTSSHIHVAATLAGLTVADLDAVIASDPADGTKWTVSPPGTTADGPGSWPPGAVITISVDATATDLFAQRLGKEASASFMVKS